MFRLVQKSPPGFLQTGSGAFPAAPSAQAFDATTHLKKAPEQSVQVKRSLISIFWKSRVYLDYSIATDKISRIELAESSLQIRTSKFPLVKFILPSALNENELPTKCRFSKNSVPNPQTAHELSIRLGLLSRTLLCMERYLGGLLTNSLMTCLSGH